MPDDSPFKFSGLRVRYDLVNGMVDRMATPLTNQQHGQPLEVLLDIARDLTASLAASDRYGRLLASVRRLIPCDAACLLRLDGGDLVMTAAVAALSRRYPRREHPRLDVILSSREPVRFPVDSALPDPFDGVIESARSAPQGHACLGCALTEGGGWWARSRRTRSSTPVRRRTCAVLATLGALAGAALRTTSLIEALEQRADHRRQVARELQRSAAESRAAARSSAPARR